MTLTLAEPLTPAFLDADGSFPGTTAISVVIPAKNEERNIAWVLQRIPNYVDEVILVDGHSTDRTVEVARAVRPDIRVLVEAARGKGAALRTGFAAATGDVVVMLDADGSMDPVDIETYVNALAEGADVAKGSRFLTGGGTADMTPIRHLGNRALLIMVNVLYRARFTELCYGYMALRRSGVQSLGLTGSGFEIETEIVVRSPRVGLRVVEVPSYEAERRFGTSNLNATRDGIRVFRTLLVHRFRRSRAKGASGTWVPSQSTSPAPVAAAQRTTLALVQSAPPSRSPSADTEDRRPEALIQESMALPPQHVPTA